MKQGFIQRSVVLSSICSAILIAGALIALPEEWAAPTYVLISVIANLIFYRIVKKSGQIKSFGRYLQKVFTINASIAIPPIVALTISGPQPFLYYLFFLSFMATLASFSAAYLAFDLHERSVDPDPSVAGEDAEPFYAVPDVLMQSKNPVLQHERDTLYITSSSSSRSIAGKILIWLLVTLVLLTPGYQLLYGATHWMIWW